MTYLGLSRLKEILLVLGEDEYEDELIAIGLDRVNLRGNGNI